MLFDRGDNQHLKTKGNQTCRPLVFCPASHCSFSLLNPHNELGFFNARIVFLHKVIKKMKRTIQLFETEAYVKIKTCQNL